MKQYPQIVHEIGKRQTGIKFGIKHVTSQRFYVDKDVYVKKLESFIFNM